MSSSKRLLEARDSHEDFPTALVSHESSEDGRQALETAFEARVGDGFFLLGLVRENDAPTAGLEPLFAGDDGAIATVADSCLADEQVGQLHGGNDPAVVAGSLGFVVIPGGLDEHIGKIMTSQIERAELRMINAEDFALGFEKILSCFRVATVDFLEVLRERGGHGDFSHVMHQTGHVIDFVIDRLK